MLTVTFPGLDAIFHQGFQLEPCPSKSRTRVREKKNETPWRLRSLSYSTRHAYIAQVYGIIVPPRP